MINTKCPLCGSLKNYRVLYPPNFKRNDLNIKTFSARRLPDRLHYKIVKCNKDSLIRSNPVLEENQLAYLYKKSAYTYETEEKWLKKNYMEALKPILSRLPKQAKILEIGCGNGFILEELLKKGYKNISGIDPSGDAFKKAADPVKKKIKPEIFKPGIFTNDYLDLIYFFQTFDHILYPNKFLKECFKILKPGGCILSYNHDFDSLPVKILGDKSPVADIEHTFFYTRKTIKKLFEKHCFTVKKVYSPVSLISLQHLIWLSPLPKGVKITLLKYGGKILNLTLFLKLGNLCLIARK